MGQARIRGTREQRVEQALKRDHDALEEATKKWAALTPEEKAGYIHHLKSQMRGHSGLPQGTIMQPLSQSVS